MSSSSFSRAGAIDLSQLAARAQQPPAGAAGAPRGGASYVLEVTEQTFEAETIRRSVQHPVVVELYSPRVTSGQQLSQALAEIANASDGKFLLARLDVDTAPGIVQALQLQAVPTVIALIGGQVAPLFQGVLPKAEVQAYVDQLLTAAVANGIVGRADPVGGAAAADEEVEGGPDPRFAAADAAIEQGDFDAAVAEFDRLLQADPNDVEAKAGRAQAGLFARAAALDPQAVLATAETSTAVEDQLAAADVEMLTGQAELAFDRLIALVRRSAGDERNSARVRLLELFETLGNADERVLKGRRDLMAALF
ncbi:putative thioredoxin [Friedmanniella luteola]|uniref:Putative thioredoxin n=1 Tax=Friedmanniella luteola TaxID=546871 RepID=A0A1H1V196_9ACTN|nr:tetratricopeptide repeat protein [Friedmanniella luteola]SDS77929.1 putative thioredoxin [Friedmanniella luteola]